MHSYCRIKMIMFFFSEQLTDRYGIILNDTE